MLKTSPGTGICQLVPLAALTPGMRIVLVHLNEAHDLAIELRMPPWQLAVELSELRQIGCTRNALRWLIGKGCVQHAIEKTLENDTLRSFDQMAHLMFGAKSCFLLTPSGIAVARQLAAVADKSAPSLADGVTGAASQDRSGVPHWSVELRELRLDGLLIKAFKQPALNQETILASFEEDGWAPRIDNPISPQPGKDAKRCLHDAIKRLNHHQHHPLIQFHSVNNGEGIRWERVLATQPEPKSAPRAP